VSRDNSSQSHVTAFLAQRQTTTAPAAVNADNEDDVAGLAPCELNIIITSSPDFSFVTPHYIGAHADSVFPINFFIDSRRTDGQLNVNAACGPGLLNQNYSLYVVITGSDIFGSLRTTLFFTKLDLYTQTSYYRRNLTA
jgi:hypothetical protein